VRQPEIRAAGIVAAPADAVLDHLADLRTHWELTGGRVRLTERGPEDASHGGEVRMRGPLGIRRRAVTEVSSADPPRLLVGRARIGRRTEARIRWELEPAGERMTLVELSAEIVAAGALDRLLLALGARRWLERLFRRVVGRLEALGPSLADARPVETR
jgi:Polyketide cyclase / dehydrase and lipid transport